VTNAPEPHKESLPEKVEHYAEDHWLLPAIGALLVWGFWAFLPKMALQTLQPHSVIMYESLGNLLIALPILVQQRFRLQWHKRGVSIIALSSVLTVSAILSYFYALHHGPVSIIVTVSAMYPVISLVLAGIFLHERLNKIQYCAVAAAMLSILLLAWPS